MRIAKLEVACVVGARPNFVKMAPLIAELRRRPTVSAKLIHTGQHFSPEMSKVFFEELEMPRPDIHLSCAGGSQTVQMAEVMKHIEPVLEQFRPDVVVVVGDVNSTLAAALVASKLHIPVAHVEAGLRSFDRRMPEEINRILTDAISDLLFVTESSGSKNLLAEGIAPEKIHFVGNLMIDALLRSRTKAEMSKILTQLNLEPRKYGVVTLHRPSNVDEVDQLSDLLGTLEEAASRVQLIFPVHPRTRARLREMGWAPSNVILTEPLGYLDFLQLMANSRLVLTDSGGIQEETTVLGVPCLTLRENTERPVTLERGTNQLIGRNRRTVLEAVDRVLTAERLPAGTPELWDGNASRRIADILEAAFLSSPETDRVFAEVG
jgi:UDP-N-acetylglucosamine 2-epimerase (non-hydrolysing)